MAVPTNTHPLRRQPTFVKTTAGFHLAKTPETTPQSFPAQASAKATQTLQGGTTDALRAPNADNFGNDGDDASASTKTPPTDLGNYCQIFQDTILCRVAPRWWTRQA